MKRESVAILLGEDQPEVSVKEALPKIAEGVARGVVAYFAEPENIAGFTGALVLPALVARGRPMHLVPAFILAVAGDQVFRRGYRASRDLTRIADWLLVSDGPDTDPPS